METIWAFLSSNSISTIIALLGLLLSLSIAAAQWRKSTINIKIESFDAITSDTGIIFFAFVLSNKSSHSLSLVSTQFRVDGEVINNSEAVYTKEYKDAYFKTEPIILTSNLPSIILPYESKQFFLSVDHPHIKSQWSHLIEAHNQEAQRQGFGSVVNRLPILRVFATPSMRFFLVTSRGCKACRLPKIDVRDSKWLKEYAIRLAIYEEKYERFD